LSNKTAPPRPAPRLYLATPEISDPAALAGQLPDVLRGADVAAVLVRLKETDPRSMITIVKALAPAVHAAGAALLIAGHPDLVARAGADGAHLGDIAALDEALPGLKPDRIAGVGGLMTRHDSMTAGERADYVLFGEPDATGSRPSTEAIADRLGWWAELFEPPCVGYAATRDEAIEFVGAGADFILVDDLVWTDARGPAAALAELGAAIKAAYTAPTTAG
jgi:thiamine-phosphate pyrophosphorylase